ncbi:hypothetical protein [Candidatus Kryptobacter tengchongensis]|uniref:Outer membrane protein beta-barrel domain-containing protein n=1 Tax=Kryptobacter tengchongensis TaxID=1643429 RepID=A0A656D2H5_KRYT1|nr:hypothetical protein [Candidatus Kryptobacter tengchongensis]CUS97510.1 hypothetical protein JGI24_00287 [Candidatus Kryptobacter tengchongensis]
MTGKIFKTAILFIFVFLTGCGPTYLPAIFDSAPPMSTPTEVKGNSTFVGGYYNQTDGFHKGESNKFLRVNFNKAIGGSWYRFSGGALAYFGEYNVTQHEDRGKKSYFGIGADIDANAFLPLRFLNIGIGLYGGVISEFGDYALIWKGEGENSILKIFTPLSFSYFFTQFNISENDKLSVRLGLGLPGGYSLGVSYYNINYGGFWGGFYPSGGKISFTSVGGSVRIK